MCLPEGAIVLPRDGGRRYVFIPGGFERKMPAVVEWFAKSR